MSRPPARDEALGYFATSSLQLDFVGPRICDYALCPLPCRTLTLIECGCKGLGPSLMHLSCKAGQTDSEALAANQAVDGYLDAFFCFNRAFDAACLFNGEFTPKRGNHLRGRVEHVSPLRTTEAVLQIL